MSLVNIDELLQRSDVAEGRVLRIQAKLHRWARDDPDRRFGDLFNFVYDPAVPVVAWRRVVGNKGAGTAGVDGLTARHITRQVGEASFLEQIRAEVKTRTFEPLPVRERLIPKPGGRKVRRLGIPATRDRVVQAALKIVLEPIYEADFLPCSYGFRPQRRTWDAIAEAHFFTSRGYEWIVEGDIRSCFDEISHAAVMNRVRLRVTDKRVLSLVKGFLKAGILTTDGDEIDSVAGTPQGGILSPLLANIALSVLDEHFAEVWKQNSSTEYARRKQRHNGQPNYRLIRYADDFLLVSDGDRNDAQEAKSAVAEVLAEIGLHLSDEKTRITHIDEGFDFLSVRIQRHRHRSNTRHYVYTYPSKPALRAVMAKVKTLTSRATLNWSLTALLIRLNRILRGWAVYHRHGCAKATFTYLHHYTWQRVGRWLKRKHARITWHDLNRRYCPNGLPTMDGITLFDTQAVAITRYRYRGTRIPNPWDHAA